MPEDTFNFRLFGSTTILVFIFMARLRSDDFRAWEYLIPLLIAFTFLEDLVHIPSDLARWYYVWSDDQNNNTGIELE